MRLSNLTFLCLWLSALPLWAQLGAQELKQTTKEEKFLYPIDPGKPGSLAGNMGELRSTHFHSGIDVRTYNEIGHVVHAAKSGYISRVSVSPSGYGNVLYINHPDGYITLYAHLNNFTGPIADYVLQEQYKQKTFDIDLILPEGQFTVQQGEPIAISGNTGSSGGPHLHFDIRDNQNFALNPLKFGFKEIHDVTPPVAEKVALITLDANARINDRFGRFEFYAYRRGNDYSIASPIMASGNIGIEVLAKDKFIPKGSFYGGVNYIDMLVNNQPVFKQAIERFDLEETRGIYTLMNFKTLRTTGRRFYKLYVDDGNSLPFYDASPSRGTVKVLPGTSSNIDIKLRDSFGNESDVSFILKGNPKLREVKNLEPAPTGPVYDIYENTMVITAKPCPGENNYTVLYTNGRAVLLSPDYYNNRSEVYLVDLRKYLPDSVILCNKSIVTHLLTTIPSDTEYTYYSDELNIHFPADALYDTLYLNNSYRTEGSFEIYTLGDRTMPLHRSITIELATRQNYSKDQTLGVYRVVGKSYVYLGGKWKNGRLTFQTRELGDFTIRYDTVPPAIRALSLNSQKVRFKISDNLSGIASYNAYINGEWLLMHYDRKYGTIWSERLDKGRPLRGALRLEVTDYAGNKQTYTHTIQ